MPKGQLLVKKSSSEKEKEFIAPEKVNNLRARGLVRIRQQPPMLLRKRAANRGFKSPRARQLHRVDTSSVLSSILLIASSQLLELVKDE